MSRERTTQGDFSAMQMYSISTKPMVYEDETNTRKSFYADDGAGAGTLETIHEWSTSLLAQGPKCGYFPNASKTIILVKSQHYQWALQIFAGSGVNVTTDATKYLGGHVGPRETCDQLTRGKVGTLITHLEKLSELAKAEPHAAYSYFVSRSQHTYVQRVTPPSEQIWKPLEEAIRNKFITALFGCDISDELRQILRLPVKMGGMGIHDPTGTAITNYAASRKVCDRHIQLPTTQSATRVPGRHAPNTETRNRKKTGQEKEAHQKATIYSEASQQLKKQLDHMSTSGAFSWLSARPLKESDLRLSKPFFLDLTRLRYLLPLETCVCGKDYTITHALICATGGFNIRRHNDVRDYLAQSSFE